MMTRQELREGSENVICILRTSSVTVILNLFYFEAVKQKSTKQIDHLENDAMYKRIHPKQYKKTLFQENSILILSLVLLSDDKSWIHISGCSQSAVSSASHNDLFGRQPVGDDNIAGDDDDNDNNDE